MLKIDRTNGKLLRLKSQLLSESGLKERSDLQQLIFKHADEFFREECGEKIFVIAQEMQPCSHVADRIDLLALDSKGMAVVIELKRGNNKWQLLQALSYAAMIADLEPEDILKAVDPSRKNALDLFFSKVELGVTINAAQRVILIAESYDYEVLQTAKWLTEQHGVNIACYEIALARDQDNNTDYLSAVQLYPVKQLADQARWRGARRSQEENQPRALESQLERCANRDVQRFFQALLRENPRRNRRRDSVVYPAEGKMRFRFTARKDYARVVQLGRFEGDDQKWIALSNPKLKVETNRLRLRLYTERDVETFEHTLKEDLPNIVWTAGLNAEEEADEEEDEE